MYTRGRLWNHNIDRVQKIIIIHFCIQKWSEYFYLWNVTSTQHGTTEQGCYWKLASKLQVLKVIESRKHQLGLSCGLCSLKENSAHFFPLQNPVDSSRDSVSWLKHEKNLTCSHITRILSRQGCTPTTYFDEDLHNPSTPRPPWVGVGGGRVSYNVQEIGSWSLALGE